MSTNSYRSAQIRSAEITPEHIYRGRRQFLQTAGVVGMAALLAACGQAEEPAAAPAATSTTPPAMEVGAVSDEMGDPLTSYEAVTNYNNFYEFTTDKEGVARLAKDFRTTPWQVEVGGLVNKPLTIGIEDLVKKYPQEERIYRLRCVEGWSMVIPWLGFSLAMLLKDVEPTAQAKYVRFETLYDPEQMPGQSSPFYPWPYQEGLRIDEAMHDLTILASGVYGRPALPQNGAPLRLVVPWKYGFKSIKSIVKIELVEQQPETLWSTIAPNEYGFYANVNPEVDHPRWSQSSERRIGDGGRRDTLMFNGYAEQVAHLYTGMDLKVNY